MNINTKKIKRILIKIGSNVLSSDSGLRLPFFTHLAGQIALLREQKIAVVIVSSGAIATAMAFFGKSKKPHLIPEKQAYAAFGQPMLMHHYAKAFQKKKLNIAQILLTQADLENRKRFLNAKHAIQALLDHDIIPIINENDTVAVDELKVGDNDQLSAHVANLIEADLLLILSNIDGLYDSDPAKNPDAKLISEVEKIDQKIESLIFTSNHNQSTGGMTTKLKAAQICTDYGIPVLITNGFKKNFLKNLLAGKNIGTTFIPKQDALAARKHWICNIIKPKGTITVDDGAKNALLNKKSLLASGIKSLSGDFEIGDCVTIVDIQQNLLGKGLASYGKKELEKIQGQKSSAIESILGYKYGDEAIHRDDLVITRDAS